MTQCQSYLDDSFFAKHHQRLILQGNYLNFKFHKNQFQNHEVLVLTRTQNNELKVLSKGIQSNLYRLHTVFVKNYVDEDQFSEVMKTCG